MDSFQGSFLDPRSVAIIGASDNPNKVGGRPIHYMLKHGYRGRIFPVNPSRSMVQGLQCYPALDAVPEIPDVAIIAVDGGIAVDAVEQCARRGVSTAIVMTAGFSELGEAGLRNQQDMVAYARRHSMRVLGPNALGLANFSSGAILSFSTMFMDVEPKDGPIALVGQSGASCVMPYSFLREAGLGARYLIGSGNDADLSVCELVHEVVADPYIRLVLVYVETMRRPDLLARAADIARARGARIVLLKGGSSARGAVAAASHTGAMASDDVALDAFLRRHGIWRVRDMHGLVNAAAVYLDGHNPRSGRTIVMSHSGGLGVMCADVADHVGLPLAELAPATCGKLAAILPGFATATNPLDLTAALLGNRSMFADALDTVGEDAQADMFLVGIPVAGPGYDVPALARTAAAFAQRERKPLVVSAPQEYVRQECLRHGLAVYRNETDALGALQQYWAHARLSADTRPAIQEGRAAPAPFRGVMDEAASLAWLKENGLPMVDYQVCASADEAVAAFERFGAGVVIKGCAAEITHKSEHGLVHLDVRDSRAARLAATACLDRLGDLGCATRRVIVAPLVRGLHEFMLGVSVDPVFGPLVMVGEGGKLVEVRADVVSLIAPFTEEEVLREMGKLRIAPLFPGFRGAPALDVAAVARAAVALGDLAVKYRSTLRSVDINPLMVLPAGEGAVGVDAVVEFQEEQ